MPVTFGSVGDIIAVGLLIKDLIKCLDGTRGSSSEYQAIVRELQSLDYAFLQVKPAFLSHQELEESNVLQETALRIAKQCENCIREYNGRSDCWFQVELCASIGD